MNSVSQVQILDEAVDIYMRAIYLKKGMKPSLLLSAIGKL